MVALLSWRSLFIGGVSAGLMAVSVGQTHMVRASYNKVTFMPMLLVLCLGLNLAGVGAEELEASRAGRDVRRAAAVHL